MTRHMAPLTRPALTGTQGIFAQKRKGKSYTAQTQAEDWLEEKQQIAVIDPTGAWWGLRSSADGKSPGYAITIFGGEHADAPLEVKAGSVIADAMVSERFSAVLDLSLLDPEEWPVVVGDFLDTLYTMNRTAMHVFIDEADQFAPQTPETKAQQKSRRVVNRLVRLGGIKGIGTTMITQRTAVLDKNITEQCDTIVALQMNGTLDLDKLRKWLANHTSRNTVDDVIGTLGSLPRGRAWVLSPATETFVMRAVREKRTFDSGRTPEPGEIVAPPKELAAVDIKRLGKAIAATVEKAQANDPVALRAKVSQLEAQLAKRTPAEPVIERVEVPVVSDAQLDNLRAALYAAEALGEDLKEQIGLLGMSIVDIKAAIELNGQFETSRGEGSSHGAAGPVRSAATPPKSKKREPLIVSPPTLLQMIDKATAPRASKADQETVLNALGTIEALGLPASIPLLSCWIGVHPKTKSFLTTLGTLRADGLLDKLQLTGNGRAVARVSLPASDDARRDMLRASRTETELRILDTVASLGREPSHTEIAAWMGVHPKTKSLLEGLGQLRTLGFLDGNALTDVGRLVAAARPMSNESVLAALGESEGRIARAVIGRGEYGNITELAADLGVHPKTKSLLTDIGILRSRGLLTKGWPLQPTAVFGGTS